MSDVIHLNVGGVTFSTTRTTLTLLEPDSFLARLARRSASSNSSSSSNLNGAGLPTALDRNGFIFIDRDGERFRTVLNYLRTGTIHATDLSTLGALRDEAEFYCLPKLSSFCSAEITRLELESYLVSLNPTKSHSQAHTHTHASTPTSPTDVTVAAHDSVFRLDAEF